MSSAPRMKKKTGRVRWLNSIEARQALGVSSCDLAHLREAGRLPYEKRGNAFRYSMIGVDKLKKERPK